MNSITCIEWEMTTLDQLGRIVTGKTPSSHNQEYFGGGIPFITPSDFDGTRLIDSTKRSLTPLGADAVKGAQVPSEAVMVTCIGSQMGQSAMTTTPSVTNQQINSIIVHPDNDALFIYYNLSNRREEIHSLASGSAVPILNKSAFGQLTISLPPLRVQQSISHILGTLDDKIELNRRMNQTLEEMAHAIYKDWFVDFGPVRAKIEGLEPYLPPDLWELFPDRLVDSEFGNIPEKWEVKALSDCFNLTMGQSPPGTSYNDNGLGLPFFQGSANFGFRFPEYSRYCTKPTKEAKADDTLVSVRAPVGALNMAWERCCIGRGVAALRHKSGSSSFTYLSARNMQPDLQLYEQTGTVFGAITRKQFEALKILEPTNELIRAFDKLIVPLDCQIRNNMAGTHNLSLQRDAMLLKLVSGEIRVGVQY